MKKISHFLCVLFFCSNLFAQGQIINVPGDQLTIQSAINASTDGDTVLVADGTYFENINFRGKAIVVASHFLIDGDAAHIDSTIINGSQPTHPDSGSVVIFVSGEDTTSVLYGFTITGGRGIINPPDAPSSFAGGGIAITSGAKIQHNKIRDNSVTYDLSGGGGIVISSPNHSVLILNNEITNNKLYSSSDNYGGGGGIFCYKVQNQFILIAENKILNNTITTTNGNPTGMGGGITLNSSVAIIQNNLIANNQAQDGGGLKFYNYPGNQKPMLINNTIINNIGESGGIEGSPDGSTPLVLNSIVWGNTSPNVTSYIAVEYSDIEGGFVGKGNINLDPQFADTTNYYLSPTSPCVDAGNPLSMYFDVEDPNNFDFPLSPALGGLRNDMGAYGGNPNMVFAELPDNVSKLKIDDNNDYIPDRLNELVTTTGVVTSINFQKSSGNLGFYIQDASFGIYIFAANDDSTNFEIGDWIEVTGTVSQYSGLTEIEVTNTETNLVLLEKNHSFATQTIYIDELLKNPEKYEGMSIKINALKKDSGDWPSTNTSTNLEITDGYKTLTLRLDDDTDLDSNPEPVYPINLVGIVSQFTSSHPANDGYQLMVNSYSDIEQNVQAAPSPYFFFTPETKELENGEYGVGDTSNFQTVLDWDPAVDFNDDNLKYEVAVIRNDGILVNKELSDNGGTATKSTKTNNWIVNDFIANYGIDGKFTGNWIILVTDGITDTIVSVDTLKNFTLQTLVAVEDENQLPTVFTLEQNYPNPFNPSTTIKYSIPSVGTEYHSVRQNVTLRIYDILGREVTTLVNQKQKPGNYEVTWDASNVSSGVYFYKLSAGSYAETKKMILLR